jgi:hypothetical protein
MIHFLYLIGFAFFVGVAFGVFRGGRCARKDNLWTENFRSVYCRQFGFGMGFLFFSVVKK